MRMIKLLGVCGNYMLIDPNSIEYAYPTVTFEGTSLNIGLKSGKKLFAQTTFEEFQRILEKNKK